jgi:hypothetical protein
MDTDQFGADSSGALIDPGGSSVNCGHKKRAGEADPDRGRCPTFTQGARRLPNAAPIDPYHAPDQPRNDGSCLRFTSLTKAKRADPRGQLARLLAESAGHQ